MAIVRQNDKRSGITYVYESTSYWGTRRSSRAALIGSLLAVLTPKLARWFPLKVGERDVASQRTKPLYSEKEARCRQFTPSGFSMALPTSLTRLERLQVLLLI